MQARRPPVSPLAIVLPHPPLSRRRSSLRSSISSPHTPRSCADKSCSSIYFASAANRKSTDSWNSSNGADDIDCEWRPDQTLLLSRTLDALPAHLVTPFNGPVPPSNLLDKIARGVSQAKGPVDWPHSLRATRAKLAELARLRAKEDAHRVIDEEDDDGDVLGPEISRRPLYRQSSMDFVTITPDRDSISRLSTRLQRTDRIIAHHPYPRPHKPTMSPSLLTPSTPSSSTLNSASTFSRPNLSRRSVSTLASSASSGDIPTMAEDPRVQRVRRSDSFYGTPSKSAVKRAPSFGALAQRGSSPTCSSDEEEKARTRSAKKLRTRTPSTPSAAQGRSPPTPARPRANLKRNPSIFGAELPPLALDVLPVLPQARGTPRSPAKAARAPESPVPGSPAPGSPLRGKRTKAPAPVASPQTPSSPMSPAGAPTQKVKTLRRVRRLPPARRISFGSLAKPDNEGDADTEGDGRGELGSAFQLM